MVVYISDLDGTLLRNDATLSGYSYRALSRMIHSGLKFTVASARSVVSIRQMLRGLELPLPVIEFNGAFVTDMASGRKLIVNDLERSILDTASGVTRACGASLFVSTFDGASDWVYYSDATNEGMRWYIHDREAAGDDRFAVVKDVSDRFGEHVVCLTVIDRLPQVERIRSHVEQEIPGGIEIHLMENRYNPGWHWLTIHDARATKGRAIKRLLGRVGLTHAETVVFGDHVNDLKMFEVAQRSYAVSNSDEILKRQATAVIGANEEDSVVKYIENEWEPGSEV